jgi:phospholipid transport system substrate-binding protein
MSLSRRLVLARFGWGAALPLAAGLRVSPAGAAAAGSAPAVIEHFYGELLAVMKQARRLSFDQRYAQLAPTISRVFDLGLMTRIAVGPGWTQIPAEQQQRLSSAFSRYTISMYANRFDDYGGERFEVSPAAAPNANGVIVNSRLVKTNGESVSLNYLLRQEGGGWKVIDVYLSGTVSELAARRSEFAAVLQRNGAEGLVQMIEQRTAALRTG